MTIWKLGCNWGKGKPSFYNFIKNEKIIIGVESQLYSKNDLAIITEGYTVKAIVKVITDPIPSVTNINLKAPFEEYKINFEPWLIYAIAHWYVLPKNKQFQYKLQAGIRKVVKAEIVNKVQELWSEYENTSNYTSLIPTDIIKNSPLLNPLYNMPKNQILFGPPGTGKTYNTINKAIQIANPEFNLNQDRSEIKKEYDRLVSEGQIVFTTFHQSMSYEDFVEGIKPCEPKDEKDPIHYKVENGIFKQICKEATKKKVSKIKIEEAEAKLAEAEVTPEIFSEYYKNLVALLPDQEEKESKYKLKTPTEYTFELYKNSANSITVKAGTKKTNMCLSLNELQKVYFEDKKPTYESYAKPVIDYLFKEVNLTVNAVNNINKNYVLIIDEINRGNVSQIFGELITLLEEDKRQGESESLELTLPYSKEKFSVPSNLYVIGTMNTADRSVEALDTALRRRFSFEEMPPKDELIQKEGKANDGKIEDFDLTKLMNTINKRIEKLLDKDHLIGHSYFLKLATLDDLRNAFQNNIIPLLQEYFFGDYGKIGLILGKGFFENEGKQEENSNNIFADFNGFDVDFLSDKPVYKLKDFSHSKYNEDFKRAISVLVDK